jgi:hypothetical protein
MSDGDALISLREQFRHMRHELVGRLAQRIDGGQLAMLGSVGGALAAVEAMLRDGGHSRSIGTMGDE